MNRMVYAMNAGTDAKDSTLQVAGGKMRHTKLGVCLCGCVRVHTATLFEI